jgi:hypothetical protein
MDQLSLFPGVAERLDTAATELPSTDEALPTPMSEKPSPLFTQRRDGRN